jgi:hypothetical protein
MPTADKNQSVQCASVRGVISAHQKNHAEELQHLPQPQSSDRRAVRALKGRTTAVIHILRKGQDNL